MEEGSLLLLMLSSGLIQIERRREEKEGDQSLVSKHGERRREGERDETKETHVSRREVKPSDSRRRASS